ncbi:MAG: flagellar hook-basal body complex protein FliE [Oscillospiraceae bacterium]|jgi:flagellar hook-basal body complex protein FliE|nr:flagellar hook-basal body complex protein FliE [Oscillospiraceae bacterium]
MSGMLLDAQKAEIALNLALQIRNKVLDAYNDIIRMQV